MHCVGDKPLAKCACTTRPVFSLFKEHFCICFLNLGWPLNSLAGQRHRKSQEYKAKWSNLAKEL